MRLNALRPILGLLALLAGMGSGVVSAATDESLQFLTHEMPPLNFSADGVATGLTVDVVRELQKRTDTQGQYALLPWARALVMASRERNVLLFFVTRTPERERQFQWVGPLVNLSASVYAKANSALQVSDMRDLAQARAVIVHRGSYLEQALREQGIGRLVEANTPEDAVRMLLESDDRTLLLLTNAPVRAALHKWSPGQEGIRPLFMAHRTQGYIAISAGTAPDLAQRYQKALDDMKRDGSFAAIYARWLPDEAPPGLRPEPELNHLRSVR